MNRRHFLKQMGFWSAVGLAGPLFHCGQSKRPNVLWIVAEDMSPHWSCYGETTIQTPNIDRLSEQGVQFNQAFVSCPVCSPIRSALISGMYQTKLGAHNHRSQGTSGKKAGEEKYWPSYEVPVKLLPQLFQEAGYFTVLASNDFLEINRPDEPPEQTEQAETNDETQEEKEIKLGKTDYNFVWDRAIYDSNTWADRAEDQPFFAQIQLRGGKYRNAPVDNPVDPAKVDLPPYYPDHPVMREDWARYLNSVLWFDKEVGEIMERLESEGLAENTVVFLYTDHGISHLRGKQFLYDEGIHIPLIARWPGELQAGTKRNDPVTAIDISVSSLNLAGIAIPDYMDGQPLFDPSVQPRSFIAAARDRCDETIECIRCIRTDRYKYIRNYFSNKPHMQPNRYKLGKDITQTMIYLHEQGKLNDLQARIFEPSRPPEELYDLQNDPHEIKNLADDPAHQETLQELAGLHRQWIKETRDMGLFPEPVLEELGLEYGNKYFVLQDPDNLALLDELIRIIEIREQEGDAGLETLVKALDHDSAAVRYRACYEIGNLDSVASAVKVLRPMLEDDSEAVRIAAARALCRAGKPEEGTPVLQNALLNSGNHVIRHHAALFFEDIAPPYAEPYLEDFKTAEQDSYEFVTRVAERLVKNLS
ncbi:sulfatase-like hydrolase/transferase [candidate division KSB1 bacterium]|nr:sulfatase-like hydrolase/transferase [candidate division KSB1 bacterium]